LAKFIRQTQGEYFYRSNLQTYLNGCAIPVKTDSPNNKGYADLVVNYKDKVYVFELKVVGPLSEAVIAAEKGLKQIREKGYGSESAVEPIRISLAVSTEIRNIAACIYETGGKAVLWESEELTSSLTGKKSEVRENPNISQ
jgi:hypothetical protein